MREKTMMKTYLISTNGCGFGIKVVCKDRKEAMKRAKAILRTKTPSVIDVTYYNEKK